jgi:eukaryotic-like serine/threonine-protein kinase
MSSVLERLSAALSDRYRLDGELGAGGMATVYLAHDLSRHGRAQGGDSALISSFR